MENGAIAQRLKPPRRGKAVPLLDAAREINEIAVHLLESEAKRK